MLHQYMGIYLQCLCEITAAHVVVWKADIFTLVIYFFISASLISVVPQQISLKFGVIYERRSQRVNSPFLGGDWKSRPVPTFRSL